VLACSAVAGGVVCGLRWCSRRTSKTGGTWPSTSAGTATRPARKHQARELAAASPACKGQGGNVCAGKAPHTANAYMPLLVCHHFDMSTRDFRSKYSEQRHMGCGRGSQTMTASTSHAFLIAAVVMQLPTIFVACAAASTVIFPVNAAADTIESVVSCVTITF